MKKVFFLLALAIMFLPMQAHAESISIAVTSGEITTYELFIGENGNDPLAIHDFNSTHSTRPSVDLVLIMQALHLGGNCEPVTFHVVPNYARGLCQVKSGEATIFSQDAWRTDFDDSVFMSSTVIGRGEFKKAVYGRADNIRLMQVRRREDMQKLVGLTGLSWTVDIETMTKMGVKQIVHAPKYELHFKMIQNGRADFGLLELSDPSNIHGPLPEGLAVVKGISVGLDESRHFMVSKKNPSGPKAFQALERGLDILRERGTLKKAFRECGFINPTLNTWKQIYP